MFLGCIHSEKVELEIRSIEKNTGGSFSNYFLKTHILKSVIRQENAYFSISVSFERTPAIYDRIFISLEDKK